MLLDNRGGAAAVVFFLFPSLENETIPPVHLEQLSAEEREETFHSVALGRNDVSLPGKVSTQGLQSSKSN